MQKIFDQYTIYISAPVTVPETGYAEVTLYFDNVTMTGVDQVFDIDLVQIDAENGANIVTTPSTIVLEPIGKNLITKPRIDI